MVMSNRRYMWSFVLCTLMNMMIPRRATTFLDGVICDRLLVMMLVNKMAMIVSASRRTTLALRFMVVLVIAVVVMPF